MRPHLTFDELGEIGLVQEVNRLLLHPVGLALARHEDGSLTVHPDPDPEGWQFEEFDLREKADAFAARQAEWHPRRLAALGYVVQPIDGDAPPFPRGESERLWHPCPPHVIWPFRCTRRHPTAGRCRRGRRHTGDHWARDIWWDAL